MLFMASMCRAGKKDTREIGSKIYFLVTMYLKTFKRWGNFKENEIIYCIKKYCIYLELSVFSKYSQNKHTYFLNPLYSFAKLFQISWSLEPLMRQLWRLDLFIICEAS